MEVEEYRSVVLRAYHLAYLIEELPLAECLAAIDFAEATGPIVDPTLFIKANPKMQEDKTVLAALHEATAKIQAAEKAAKGSHN